MALPKRRCVGRFLGRFRTMAFAPFFLALLCHSPVQADTMALLTGSIALERVLDMLATNPPVMAAVKARGVTRVEPVFIFIPGILGSKLSTVEPDGTETRVWGCTDNLLRYNEDLNFNKRPNLRATPLLDPTSTKKDCGFPIYRDFLRVMYGSALRNHAAFLNFAYDWRQSNEKSAEDLNEYIQTNNGKLSGKTVVFVAHSMGGLVFKWWYHHYYSGKEHKFNFNIAKIFFVGTPHRGSYAAVHALQHGYTLLAQAGTFLGSLEQQLIRPLNKYGLTFPSFYQLLPFETDDQYNAKYVAQILGPGHESRIDLFSPKVWRYLGLPNKDKLELPRNVRTRDAFYHCCLANLLRQGKDFHEALAAKQQIAGARYVFSDKHETPYGLTATDANGSISVQVLVGKRRGDGTVFTDSAKDATKSISSDHMVWVGRQHRDLVIDDSFIARLWEVRSNLSKGWEGPAATAWKNDPTIVRFFAKNKSLFPAEPAIDELVLARKEWIRCIDEVGISQKCVSKKDNSLLDDVGEFNATVLRFLAKEQEKPVNHLSREIYRTAEATADLRLRQKAYQDYITVEKNLLTRGEGNLTNYGRAMKELGEVMRKRGVGKAG